MCKLVCGLFLCGLGTLGAQSICLDDRVGLNTAVRAALDQELRSLMADIRLDDCNGPAITLSVRMYPPERYRKALGLAYKSGDRVLPELRLYLDPVLKILGNERSSVAIGRALGRVAAHEVGHYINQQMDHDCDGLMREIFSGPQLAAEDSRPFRNSR